MSLSLVESLLVPAEQSVEGTRLEYLNQDAWAAVARLAHPAVLLIDLYEREGKLRPRPAGGPPYRAGDCVASPSVALPLRPSPPGPTRFSVLGVYPPALWRATPW